MTRNKEVLLTSSEVAEMLQMDPSSVVKWVNDGRLAAFRTPGGHRRIKPADLLAFLKKHGMYVPPGLGGGRLRVLLVDDDRAFLSAMKRGLRGRNEFEVESAEGGVDGLVRVGSYRPDVLVLALDLSDLDGLEVLRRLRASLETQSLQVVVVVSGKASAELERQVLALGARAFRTKPITPAVLAEALLAGG